MFNLRYFIFLDYPPTSRNEPRWGYGNQAHSKLHNYLSCQQDNYADLLGEFLKYEEHFISLIDIKITRFRQETLLKNNWISGFDALSIYGMLAMKRPRLYMEVGSGVSTIIAHKAILDQKIGTKILSIDPKPRKHIDAICDEIIRMPVEDVDLTVFDQLSAGDILFIDSSHRCFMNSDVTIIFLEILPRLKKGVIVHFHDICLPYDYPPEWIKRYYNEQYLLAAYLLAKGNLFKVLLPNSYVTNEPTLFSIVEPLFSKPGMLDVNRTGGSFWIEIA